MPLCDMLLYRMRSASWRQTDPLPPCSNLDELNSGSVEHWVCLFAGKNGKRRLAQVSQGSTLTGTSSGNMGGAAGINPAPYVGSSAKDGNINPGAARKVLATAIEGKGGWLASTLRKCNLIQPI
jgi:hypothetical protein